ncbi:carbohydrate ABC transporter permease [Agromyces tropicus]|uniref:Carbohydrate ABC transporter permease n=1 Tax=Agromyces tropicus TaxID=555371 RepID=A0ABP5GA97_9MICO
MSILTERPEVAPDTEAIVTSRPPSRRFRSVRRAGVSGVVAKYTILGLGAFLVLVPLYSILAVSLQPRGIPVAGLSWPADPQWSNYVDAWNTGAFNVLLSNSVMIALPVVVIAVFLSVLSGYAFATMKFRGKEFIFAALLIGLILPFEGIIVPLYYTLRALNLTNTMWGVALPEIGLYVSFGTFWMRVAFSQTPPSLVEAAQIDGARPWQVLWKVLFPISWPSVMTIVILFFIWSWNEFLIALVILQDPASKTAPAGLGAFVGKYVSDVPLLAAAAVIVAVPVVVTYVLLQGHVIRGMTQGAVKE